MMLAIRKAVDRGLNGVIVIRDVDADGFRGVVEGE